MGADPSLVDALCKSNGKTNFFPIGGCFFKRLYQPRRVSRFNGLFVSAPTATVFETRSQKKSLLNQYAVEIDIIPSMIEKVVVFFVSQKTARKMRCSNGRKWPFFGVVEKISAIDGMR